MFTEKKTKSNSSPDSELLPTRSCSHETSQMHTLASGTKFLLIAAKAPAECAGGGDEAGTPTGHAEVKEVNLLLIKKPSDSQCRWECPSAGEERRHGGGWRGRRVRCRDLAELSDLGRSWVRISASADRRLVATGCQLSSQCRVFSQIQRRNFPGQLTAVVS